MILTYPTKGYLIDNFPASFAEALFFEANVWRTLCGLYFVYWNRYIKDEKEIVENRINDGYKMPTFARREEPYDDIKFDDDMTTLGVRFVKIYYDKPWTQEQTDYINCLVDGYLGRTSCQVLLSELRKAAIPEGQDDETEEDEPTAQAVSKKTKTKMTKRSQEESESDPEAELIRILLQHKESKPTTPEKDNH
jgi:hypothetical protein